MPSILLRPILEDARANPSGSTVGSIPIPGIRAAIVESSPDSGRAHIPNRTLSFIAFLPEPLDKEPDPVSHTDVISQSWGCTQCDLHQPWVSACVSNQSLAQPIVESVLRRSDLSCSLRLILDKLCLFPSFKLIGSKSARTEIIGFKTSLNSVCECDCVLQTQIRPLSPSRIQGMNSISH